MTMRSGFITSRIDVVARLRRITFIATRFWTSRSTSSKTRSLGSEMSSIARERPRRPHHAPLERDHLLQPPARDVGERQEPQRLAGGRAVHDDRVELAGVVVALDLEQRAQLHPGG